MELIRWPVRGRGLLQFDLTFADSGPGNILCCDITVVMVRNGIFFIDGLGWVTKTGPMAMSVLDCSAVLLIIKPT